MADVIEFKLIEGMGDGYPVAAFPEDEGILRTDRLWTAEPRAWLLGCSVSFTGGLSIWAPLRGFQKYGDPISDIDAEFFAEDFLSSLAEAYDHQDPDWERHWVPTCPVQEYPNARVAIASALRFCDFQYLIRFSKADFVPAMSDEDWSDLVHEYLAPPWFDWTPPEAKETDEVAIREQSTFLQLALAA